MENKTYICSKCKVEKPISEFSSCKDRKRGHRSHCKSCVLEYRRINKDKLDISRKKLAERKKEETKKKRQEYYKANKDRILANNKLWRENNPEKTKELSDNYYNENKERLLNLAKK
jgi:hypothetical protein